MGQVGSLANHLVIDSVKNVMHLCLALCQSVDLQWRTNRFSPWPYDVHSAIELLGK